MAVTLKCADCGHSVQAEDEEPQTCPQCDGTMTKPKYKAKSGPTSADVEKAKAKPKPRAKPADDEEEEEEKPRQKKAAAKPKAETLSLDDEEDEEDSDGEISQDGKAAERAGIDPGFKNRALMKQVAEELSSDEVLHWAGRPSPHIVKKHALMTSLGGIFFALIGAGIMAFMLTNEKMKIPWFVAIVPGIFVLVGIAIAIFGPILKMRQTKYGWYAITDQRAIVFEVYPWGKKGKVTNYNPNQLRNTRIAKSFWLSGGGSLVFRAEVHITTTHHVDRRGRSMGTSTSKRIVLYGFLNIEDVKDVGTVLRNAMFGGGREDDDADDE